MFNSLQNVLSNCSDFKAKMKLEKINRYLVQPETAIQLPIVRSESVRAWLDELSSNRDVAA